MSRPSESRLRRTLEVPLGERSYPIHIGVGTLAQAGGQIATRTKASRVAVITVPEIARRYAPTLLRSLREAGIRAHQIVVPDGDRTKNLRRVAQLYNELLDRGCDRSSAVVALGGGMVGDLAGFTAATYLRGVPFVQVPTTLLAMVDASVGGKVGVNLRRGKNLVGAFHQPRLVWIDTATLESLPRRDRAAGVAEIIKAGAVFDAGFFERLEHSIEAVLDLEREALLPALERACAIKAEIVGRDEREDGVRRILNFGHTLAHAVETTSGYRKVRHGEAVAMGMVFAARRSEELGHAPSGTADRLEALIRRAGLPSEIPPLPRRTYLSALRVDKKRRDARIHYVVLRGIGRAETAALTPAEIYPAKPHPPSRRPK